MNLFDFIAPIYEKIHFGAEKTFQILTRLVDFQKSDKVLDLGGGKGRIAKFFANKVKEITIVDDSRGMIKQCKKYQDINCIVGKAENIPFNDGYFDKVIIIDAFHHFKDQEKASQEINRVLKENGKVIVEEVNFGKFGNWLAEKLEATLGIKSKLNSPKSLAELFTKNQFKIKLFNENRAFYYLKGRPYKKQ